ncbi:MAG: NADPH-dependent 7-cyano-7-deazaguanine reductase QueF [Pseudomonadales bacterium]|nr:NADPH-dependent 7-cyano-7-deazaguanine reductase QueF [Pseudomonadales bacterium]
MNDATENPLGKQVTYDQTYAPELLFSISRFDNRKSFMVDDNAALPFFGYDHWNAYEVSWLNQKGKPQVAIAQFRFEIETSFIIESKSFKLYLNSLNQKKFDSIDEVTKVIVGDLSTCAQSKVLLELTPVSQYALNCFSNPKGTCLDQLDIDVEQYQTDASLLQVSNAETKTETLFSHLLRSNCPITGQPDWGTIQVVYQGQQIDHASLLRYIISYRVHSGYHEQVTEQVFTDLMAQCKPEQLEVQTWFVRRGGLDINCLRSTRQSVLDNDDPLARVSRQ